MTIVGISPTHTTDPRVSNVVKNFVVSNMHSFLQATCLPTWIRSFMYKSEKSSSGLAKDDQT